MDTERRRDAERSRRRLLAGALDEFAAKGFAGARMQDIADRAGLNKQLIHHYFGSKEGLYAELQRTWLERESAMADPDLPLADLAVRYLQGVLTDPRMMRLGVWRGLSDPSEAPPDVTEGERVDLTSMQRRQAAGELAPDLDAACALFAVMALVAAPVALPQLARRVTGLDPASPEFAELYGAQLRLIVGHLADTPDAPDSADTEEQQP